MAKIIVYNNSTDRMKHITEEKANQCHIMQMAHYW